MIKINRRRSLLDYKNPAKLIFYMYLLVISIGGGILMLPVSSATGQFTNPVDAIFTASSATCVTGLATLTTASHWSYFGKFVIIFLIQLGGLGVMTAATAIGLLLNVKFNMTQRINLAEEKNVLSTEGIIKLLKYIIVATFMIELIGAGVLMVSFIPQYGLFRGIAYSIFHSISAFCNAGFDVIGENSMAPFVSNYLINLPIMALIVLGGLGFGVYKEITKKKFDFKRYSLHAKIVVSITLFLIVFPWFSYLILEWNNPQTLGPMPIVTKILAALFQSVTTRTAGFFTINQAGLTNGSVLITLILMFIGGSPSGTAGGLKTTTIVALFLIARSNIKNEEYLTIFKRRIPKVISRKVVAIFMISITWIIVVLFILTLSDSTKEFTDLLYEVISAYATVGLTRGITASLSVIGKISIIATMFFGKIGPIAMIVAFTKRNFPKPYKEAEESIIVG